MPPLDFDLAIRGGLLYDGVSPAPRRADIGIRGGRIARIGAIEARAARDSLDAGGRVVAPGFIDLHSHGDLVLAWPSEKRLDLYRGRLAQGITTEIVGNCGLGAAPAFGPARELLPAINGWMSPAGSAATWTSLSEYLAELERLGLPLNVGALVPHGALRLGAMGLAPADSDASARRAMIRELDRALDEGAFGLSAGLIYPPGMYTSTDELVALSRRLARRDAIFTCHIRGSSETLLPAVDELLHIGRQTGARVHHSHAEAVGRAHWPRLEIFLDAEDRAREEGVRISRDMFPYPVAATMMLAIYPPWALEGGIPRLLERLRDEETRRRIERDIGTRSPEWPPWNEGGWPHNLVRAVGWDRILVSSVAGESNRRFEGLSLEDLGRRTGKSPFDAVTDLLLEENGNVGQFVLDVSGEEGLLALVARPDVAFVTDANDYGKGKPHPAAYGSFPRVLGRYVRERGRLALGEALRRMSSLPADVLGLADRGRLREGAWADVVIFDPETIADRATLDDPRHQPEGIDAVVVNGRLVWKEGRGTGSLPGAVLRKESAA